MTNVFYVDGEFVTQEEAVVPAHDLSVIRGYGVFDFMRTYGRVPFELDAHIARLLRSAELIELDVHWTHEEIHSIVMETIKRNTHDESNVRIVITGGLSDNYLIPNGQSRLLVMVTPVLQNPASYYTGGVKIITETHRREIPGAKTLNYITAIRAMKRARRENAVECVYISPEGQVLEGTTTNVFAFMDGKWVTPPENDILVGITRAVVLDILNQEFEVEIRELTLDELLSADEIFISASNKEVMPVVQIEDTVVASGEVGEATKRVMARYRERAQAAIHV